MEPQRNRRVARVLMVQPLTNDAELKLLDTLSIEHIAIYTKLNIILSGSYANHAEPKQHPL